jgi:hypothetical protein
VHPTRWTYGALIVLLLALALPVAAQGNTETFSNDWVSFDYPAGWVTDDQDQFVRLGTNARAVEGGADLLPGDVRTTIWAGSVTESPFALPQDTALADVLGYVLDNVDSGETCGDFGAAQRVGRVSLLFTRQMCSQLDNISIVRDLGGGMIIFMAGTTPRGEMDAMQTTLLNVALSARLGSTPPPAGGAPTDESPGNANTIQVDPNVLPREFVSEDGLVTFRYPSGWRANEDEAYVFGITDGPQPSLPDIPGDQNHLIVAVFTPDEIPSNLDTVEKFLRDFTEDDSNGVSFEEPVLFELNGRPAASAVIDAPFMDVVMMAVEGPEGYILLYGLLDDGMYEDNEQMILTVLASVTYTSSGPSGVDADDVELSQTYRADIPFAFDYPADWEVIVLPSTTDAPTVFLTSPEFGLLIITVREDMTIDEAAKEAYDLGVREGDRTPIQTTFTVDGRAGIRVEAGDADEGFSNVTFVLEMPDGRVAQIILSIITPWVDTYDPYAMAILPTIRWDE